MSGRVIGGTAATAVIARMTARRLFRTRSFWLSVILAGLPLLFLAAVASKWSAAERWDRVFVAMAPVLGVLVPLNLATIIAEEAEEATFSFLWSRPMPRWSVITGKAAALLPFSTGLVIAAVIGSWALSASGAHPDWLIRGIAAAILGCAATGALSVALGTLIRRQAIAASVGYLLVIDFPMGNIPLSISNLSITHHFTALATGEGAAVPVIWLVAMTALWSAIAIWRVGRVELSMQ